MKKILIGYLIALTIGNLIGCTNEKVNNETNTTTEEISENQETNKTEEYQPKYTTVNYENKGIYEYKIIKCNQGKIKEIEKSDKPAESIIHIKLTCINGDEFNGSEQKYGQDGEHSFIRMVNGKEIEIYDVLERKYIKPVEPEQMFDEEYIERCFKIYDKRLNLTTTVKAIKCTEEEIQYIEKTKSDAYIEVVVTDEVGNDFKRMVNIYGDTDKKFYIVDSNNQYGPPVYYRIIE